MPQLDINTFLFQYVALVLLLIITYVLLAYVVLPQTLRTLIIRSNISSSKTDTKTAILPLQLIRVKKIFSNNLFISILVNKFKIENKDISNVQNSNTVPITAISDSYISYITLVLIEEQKEYENE